jgi:hypothetical protein
MTEHPALYWTADHSALVEEDDVRAAFLAAGPFDPIPDIGDSPADVPPGLSVTPDPKPTPEAKHAARKPKA